ncbi:MAG: hypothetical protein EOM73_10475 [Bacteroidia bacterium]|nr:hypothetical protein [Bacteroidia bacterium]
MFLVIHPQGLKRSLSRSDGFSGLYLTSAAPLPFFTEVEVTGSGFRAGGNPFCDTKNNDYLG